MSVDAITFSKTLTVGHRLKGLLFLIAENTWNDSGVCKVGQKVLIEESEIPERTLRRFLEALEQAGAIKRTRRGVPFKGGRQTDEIELVGFVEWLRVNRPIKAAKLAGLLPEQSGQQVAATNRPTGGRFIEDRTSTVQVKKTPLPRDAGESEASHDFEVEVEDEDTVAGEISDDGAPLDADTDQPISRSNARSIRQSEWLNELRREGANPIVLNSLIEPLLQQRRFSSKAPLPHLREAIAKAASLSRPSLAKALANLLGAKENDGKPIGTIKHSRLMREIGAVEACGEMIPIKPESHPEQWKRWRAHFEITGNKAALNFMRDQGVLQVATDFPPATITRLPISNAAKRECAA